MIHMSWWIVGAIGKVSIAWPFRGHTPELHQGTAMRAMRPKRFSRAARAERPKRRNIRVNLAEAKKKKTVVIVENIEKLLNI